MKRAVTSALLQAAAAAMAVVLATATAIGVVEYRLKHGRWPGRTDL